jgi:DUF4097 and DUF4098 domain-containing protein YvlB
MPTFDTPEPIKAHVEISVGAIRIDAGDRADTVVEVRPTDTANADDRGAAERTVVELRDGSVVVKGPRHPLLRPTQGGSVDVTVELPAASRLSVNGASTDVDASGALGETHVRTGLGHVRLDRTEALTVKTGLGDVVVEHAAGHADLTTGSGEVRVGELGASAAVKNSNGDTWIGAARGDLRVKAANGSVAIDESHASVAAKSANGDVRLGDAVRGSVVLETHLGDVEIGVHAGTAAWLDLDARAGKVRNALDAADGPGSSERTVEVRARTTVGEIVVRRAHLEAA